ncbi:MNN21 Alpha-1 [Candida maltosa Xu316]
MINEKGNYQHSLWDNIGSFIWGTNTKPFEGNTKSDEKEKEMEKEDTDDDVSNDDKEAVVEKIDTPVIKEDKADEAKSKQEADEAKSKQEALNKQNLKLIKEQQDKYNRLHPFEKQRLSLGYEFYDDIFKILHLGKPPVTKLDTYLSKERIYHARYDTTTKDETIFSESYLSKFLHLNQLQLQSMKKSHQYVVDNLPESAPDGLYKKNGIVYVAGGSFNWLTLLSIRQLRAVGCHLPIEVFIPKIEEYESDFCGRLLPELDARCVYMKNSLVDPTTNDGDDDQDDKYANKFEFKGYQYKAMAILLSSFENVLLLDSDNLPAHNPERLFETDPFKSYGLVVWPDYWKRATSPYYYDIANIEVSNEILGSKYNEVEGSYSFVAKNKDETLDLKQVPLHQRLGSIPDPTSESGQLLISKKTHLKPLLLALYYNLYGPTHYYPLFSQGSDGEGDKETFLAASVTLKKKYYQVSKFLVSLGHFKTEGGEFQGCGMGQHDPYEDLQYIQTRDEYLKIPKSDEQKRQDFLATNPILQTGPKILFVHANFPKLNPWILKEKKEIFDKNGKRLRLYGPGMTQRIGYDFELYQWESMKLLLCIYDVQLDIFKGIKRLDLCDEVLQQLRFLKASK